MQCYFLGKFLIYNFYDWPLQRASERGEKGHTHTHLTLHLNWRAKMWKKLTVIKLIFSMYDTVWPCNQQQVSFKSSHYYNIERTHSHTLAHLHTYIAHSALIAIHNLFRTSQTGIKSSKRKLQKRAYITHIT